MVVLHVKKGDESQFLFETTVSIPVEDLITQLVPIFNGRLKVNRICAGNVVVVLAGTDLVQYFVKYYFYRN